jgi:hypothetical protein
MIILRIIILNILHQNTLRTNITFRGADFIIIVVQNIRVKNESWKITERLLVPSIFICDHYIYNQANYIKNARKAILDLN